MTQSFAAPASVLISDMDSVFSDEIFSFRKSESLFSPSNRMEVMMIKIQYVQFLFIVNDRLSCLSENQSDRTVVRAHNIFVDERILQPVF